VSWEGGGEGVWCLAKKKKPVRSRRGGGGGVFVSFWGFLGGKGVFRGVFFCGVFSGRSSGSVTRREKNGVKQALVHGGGE